MVRRRWAWRPRPLFWGGPRLFYGLGGLFLLLMLCALVLIILR